MGLADLADLALLAAFFGGVAFLVGLALEVAPLAAGAPPVALRWAFGFAVSAAGLAACPRLWMRSQIRLMAVLGFLNFFTGVTPAKPFQISAKRSAGQAEANSASSCWVAKASKGVVDAAVASSRDAKAVISFSLLIVHVVMIVCPFRLRGHDNRSLLSA